MKINPRGYWENDTEEGHGVDRKLSDGLCDFFEKEYKDFMLDYDNSQICILDVGCGTGFYTRKLNTDFSVCDGYDGNPYTEKITNGRCKVTDFSKRIDLASIPIYDWVLCLEVGEHIPQRYERIFLDNICQRAEHGIILSWSIPEFGGDGHVNPLENGMVIKKLKRYKFDFVPEETNILRASASPYPQTGWWFSKTLMVFRKMHYWREE